jgi:hypothetical protein
VTAADPWLGSPRSGADAALRLVLLAVYVALIFYAGIDHAMWRDEAQAWLIARDAEGLGGVFRNLRYDGHPALWHTLLFILSRFGDDPNLMLALNFAIMATMAALVLWFMPLRIWERVLFPFGYFMLFEYGVKGRSYGLGGLLMVLLCLAWPARGRRPWLIALLLALLANTQVLFMIATIAIICALLVEHLLRRPGAMPSSASVMLALAIVVASWVLALWTFNPPADTGFAVDWYVTLTSDRLQTALTALPAVFGDRDAVPQWLAIAVMVATLWSIRRAPAAATWLFLSVTGILGFGYIKHAPAMWHHGVVFLTWLAAIWVARMEAPGRSGPVDHIILSACVTVVLAFQACYGTSTYRAEIYRPYSNARAVASFIAAKGWTRNVIAALPDQTVSAVIAYLGAKRFYFLNGGRFGSFAIWDQRRLTSEVEAALGDLDRRKRAVVLIVSLPSDNPALFARYGYREVARFTGATLRSEDFVLYRRASRR